jgi:hypothetical protein
MISIPHLQRWKSRVSTQAAPFGPAFPSSA